MTRAGLFEPREAHGVPTTSTVALSWVALNTGVLVDWPGELLPTN